MHLAEFNALPAAEATRVVSVWAAIPAWVDAVVAGRPYPTAGDLAQKAADAASAWTRADLDAALAHHPRIGERPRGDDAEAAASRSEQAAMATAGDDIAARISAGNAAYEDRFGRVFLIRAAGRAPEEILAALDRRLGSDPADETREAIGQLAEIALLRLRSTIADERIPS
ncbi:2-oxo-4-hydroxy-4-carboxy-5-ureidoimidazoline decarboxylase [Microbacterium ulmi]|uniref:2-oxo-4-hydroxy-4-carboxy-5-ureidoimidazoline decarboxylase n=1 Tax=Microbacterium ulmi TaxID=179095 RepID=A0A7Y2Q1C5_9MICO|nr:2-oxo-4-hydroxy-4-carboxy-5-ureidoimidazoline decarboxylase [Microbacterium ulmi]NII69574.1 2-oxo-4-hydroxy-4-carboxy-5-ureidoimidazoline decarboxylase [Microbacterium ulmi]NNH03538.1 2-oxo-4-hydroxy-4-carboxy-5-ureidoimidazoline decarboxylase [Microbacterium ulmi]